MGWACCHVRLRFCSLRIFLNIDCDIANHICLKYLELDDTNLSVIFVNQVSDVTPRGSNIDPLCCNPIDKYIQRSPNGPDQWMDRWSVCLPLVPEKTIHVTRVTDEMLGCPSLMKEKSVRRCDRYPQ